MASQKFTKEQVRDICKKMGLTITSENEVSCIAKKEFAMYRFDYIKPEDMIKMEESSINTTTKVSEDGTTNVVKKRGRPKGSKNKAKVVDTNV